VDSHVFGAACWVFLHLRPSQNWDEDLIRSCLKVDIRGVERGLRGGANINYLHEDHSTPLIIAVKKANIELLCVLLNHPEINVNQTDVIGQTPLIIVSKLTHTDPFQENTNLVLAKLLLSHDNIHVNDEDQAGTTALMYSAILGNIGLLMKLIEHGADVNHKQYTGNTALHFAVSSNNKQMVRILMDNGAKIKKNGSGKTPYYFAQSQEIKDLLLTGMRRLSSIGGSVKKYIRTSKKPLDF